MAERIGPRKITVGDREVSDTIEAQTALILVNSTLFVFKPGPRNYDRTWICDGSAQALALLCAGLIEEAKRYVVWYSKRIYENGMVPPILNVDGTVNRGYGSDIEFTRRANLWGSKNSGRSPRSAPEIPRRSQPAKFRFPDQEMERPKPRRHGRQIERGGTICSEWISADPTAGAQDATFQERSVCAEIPINACRRLQYFQRPTPPHVSSITPGAPHCGDETWREVVAAA